MHNQDERTFAAASVDAPGRGAAALARAAVGAGGKILIPGRWRRFETETPRRVSSPPFFAARAAAAAPR